MTGRFKPIGKIYDKGFLSEHDLIYIEQSLEIVKIMNSILDHIIQNGLQSKAINDNEMYYQLTEMHMNLFKLYLTIGDQGILRSTRNKVFDLIYGDDFTRTHFKFEI